MPKANRPIERRGKPRFFVKIPVKYRLEEAEMVIRAEEWRQTKENAFTLDMSLEGMQIVADQPLTAGNILPFDLFLLEKRNVVRVYSKVVRVRRKKAGLHFLAMKDDARKCLEEFLEKIASVKPDSSQTGPRNLAPSAQA